MRAALWAARALRVARKQLKREGLAGLDLPSPPRLQGSAGRGVSALLRRRSHTCLEEAVVLQRWLAAQGEGRDVIVGVRVPGEFGAHAWLDGDLAPADAEYLELTRVAP